MPTAVIVDAVRTPMGKRNGSLKDVHPVDLAALTLEELVKRSDLDPALVDDVIMGCVMQVGEQGVNIARNAALTAGFPHSVPGTTIDRQCGSSQQSLHFAAQGVMAGAYDVVVAAGVESMTRVPMGASIMTDWGLPFSDKMAEMVPGGVPQGISAEMIAEKWGLSREQLDEFSVRSQTLAAQATDEGRFDKEIIGVPITTDDGASVFDTDETFRRDTTLEALAALKPSFQEDGKITAGNSSQISDGASAVLVMSEEKATELDVTPRARFDAFALAGDDPVLMLTAPIPATTAALERSGKSLDDIDLVEINEAFAPVVLAWAAEHNPDMERVNVNGGAIALGHPLGASGARLMTTLVNELERSGKRWGLQTMCEGGGMANATVIERL
ncbi:MAG: thiolase family protein [Acidimicrobiia bacterium]